MTAQLPPALHPGDRIGVAAISGPVDQEALARGLVRLRHLGFEPVLAENLLSCRAGGDGGLFAGTDEERLEAFHALCRDSSIRGLIFARGGHGLLRLMPAIDWDLLARHPRAYVGYSDLTPFLLQVVERLGLVAFHGPMVASDLGRPDFSGREATSLFDNLRGAGGQQLRIERNPLVTGGGPAEGPLLGGCLSMVVATLGTPWQPDLEGALVFLEDVNEADYRVDRMLTHLDLSGSLRQVRGVVLGHFTGEGTGEPSAPGGAVRESAWRAQLDRLATSHGFPWAEGLECGHGAPNLTLPLGRRALLDPLRGTLEIE